MLFLQPPTSQSVTVVTSYTEPSVSISFHPAQTDKTQRYIQMLPYKEHYNYKIWNWSEIICPQFTSAQSFSLYLTGTIK